MMKSIYLSIFIFLIFGCAKPTQPELSVKERVFFKELEKQCNCSIQREIEPKLLKFPKSEHGDYFLTISVPCNKLKRDSLEKYSNTLAKILYVNILERDSKYNKITIDFDCPTGLNEFQSEFFEYNTEKLENK